MIQPAVRKPRYVLGTFWLILALAAIGGAFTTGKPVSFIVGIAMGAYSVYLYRGGRFGFVIW